ncbi:MAG: hypothetical protein FJ271_08170 [Planctomycetes bacterium]|nr:hypothetical protein [Planctomycetota bacterium]
MLRCFLLLVMFMLPVPLIQGQDKAAARYFPLEIGKEWRYRKKVIENDKLLPAEAGVVVVRVTGVVDLPDEKNKDDKGKDDKGKDDKGKKEKLLAYTLEGTVGDKKGDNRKLVEQVAVLADGVYRRSAAGKTITPPLAFLKLKESWPVDAVTNDTPIKGTFKLGQEDVTVPAGVFPKAVTSTADMLQIGEQTMYVKYWFAADVGMVKQQTRVNGYEVTLELQQSK